MTKVDPETSKQLTDADHLKAMVESDGWRIAFAKFQERILDLQNIANVDVSSPEAAVVDLKARKMAADYMFAWAKADIYGFIEQQENARDALADRKLDDFIGRT